MSKLRVGTIGLGMGSGHVRQFQGHADVDMVAVADVNAELLETRGNELGVEKRYTSAEEMIEKENLDIVSIAVPNKFHKPLTIMALEAGCDVL
ncbi:MAG: Gfo/Idh/MocA family oxidoreductase, partial [Victivallales bacterium]|nr:Gfo/Idh/MocA family oxidoreductase [Victivallales bacterium]